MAAEEQQGFSLGEQAQGQDAMGGFEDARPTSRQQRPESRAGWATSDDQDDEAGLAVDAQPTGDMDEEEYVSMLNRVLRIVGLHLVIDQEAAVVFEARRLGEAEIRPDADGHHHHIGVNGPAVFQNHLLDLAVAADLPGAGAAEHVDPARFSRSSILRHENENLIYNIAGERMMPREVFKERNGLRFVIPQS